MDAGGLSLVRIHLMQTKTYTADFINLDAIRDFVGEFAEQAGLNSKEIYSVQLAADEACSNVIEHAYEGIPDGTFDVSCSVEQGQLTIVIHDQGKPFDIEKVRQPNLGKNLDEREIGGLGVFLMHKLMDEVRFESRPKEGNLLTMLKRKSGGA